MKWKPYFILLSFNGMLQKGERIPDLSLEDHSGKTVNLQDFLGKGPVVFYFYPKNETPGCTAQACEFRDTNDAFLAKGATVVGISGDSSASHEKFRKKYNLNFTLLSDRNRKAEKAFGVKRDLFGLLPGRVTFLTDMEGVVQYSYNSAIKAKNHVHVMLNELEHMTSKS